MEVHALAAVLSVVALTAASCSHSSGSSKVFSDRAIQLQVPRTWSITGFSTTNRPRRLVAASYPVRREDVEGDCGGIAAVTRLPEDGAFVVLIDYGNTRVNPQEFQTTLPAGAEALFDPSRHIPTDCFGSSYMSRLTVDGRPLQVHVGLGSRAGGELRGELLAVVNSITTES